MPTLILLGSSAALAGTKPTRVLSIKVAIKSRRFISDLLRLPLDLVRFARSRRLAELPMVAGSQDADRQDFVCIDRRRTNACAKSRLFKKAIASTYEPWLEQPNYPPGALTYIKGDRRIDLDLLAFLATAPAQAGDSLAF